MPFYGLYVFWCLSQKTGNVHPESDNSLISLEIANFRKNHSRPIKMQFISSERNYHNFSISKVSEYI